jgi:hypothetical protein
LVVSTTILPVQSGPGLAEPLDGEERNRHEDDVAHQRLLQRYGVNAGTERRCEPAEGLGPAGGQHLGRMQNRGLVSRERCLTDQRGAVVTITPRRRDLIKAAAPQHVADVRNVLIDHLTATELDALATIGDKVRARLATLDGADPKPRGPIADEPKERR